MWEIRRYEKEDRKIWDEFVDNSPNATFLFKRAYVEYHAPRFTDHSLLALRNGKPAAVLPANQDGATLFSHQGLTYGGWARGFHPIDTTDYFNLWRAWLGYCRKAGLTSVVYKPLPYIYSLLPAQEDLYMLFLSGAGLTVTNIASAIDIGCNPGYNKLQRRHLNHTAPDFYAKVITGDNEAEAAGFYDILTERLDSRYGTAPVHSFSELMSLMQSFPENIFIYGAYLADRLEGGACLYATHTCLHCQYIATTPRGRNENILAPLFSKVIDYAGNAGKRYLDFGTSNEASGMLLNEGLNRQKTSYGASGVAYQTWEINVASALESMPTVLWPQR